MGEAPPADMTVLFVTNDFPPRIGGIEAFILSLSAGLAADPGAPRVVVYTASMPGQDAVDRSLGFPVVRDPASTLLPHRRLAERVARAVAAYGCDCVVFGAAAPLGLLAPKLRAAGVRRMIAMTHGHEVWWSKVPVARQLLAAIADSVDAITFVSEYCRREIAKALSAAARCRMHRLSPGVDVEAFRPGLDPAVMRARWGIGAGPVVLSAGRLVTRKGQDVLIEVWPRIMERHRDAHLVIVGNGPRRRRLARRAAGRGSIAILPAEPWSRMPLVYAAADVFVQPCRTRRAGLEPEAFGIVFLEAAAAGLPVVAGRSGGAAEALLDGTTGYLVDGDDPDMIATRLSMLLDDRVLARTMGEEGRRFASSRSTAAAVARLRALIG